MRGLIAFAAGAALIFTGTPAVAATADTTAPEVHSIELSRATVSVQGLDTEFVTVTARFTDDESGVWAYDDWLSGRTPWVKIGPAYVGLGLVTGTPHDGVYTGRMPVTSGWNSGTYEPTLVGAIDEAGNELSVDPRTLFDVPALQVTSSNRPSIQLSTSPDPVFPNSPLTLVVRVTRPGGAEPWPSVPVAIGMDNSCPEDVIREPMGYTDAAGVFTQRLAGGHTYDQVHCAWVTGENAEGQRSTRIVAVATDVRYKYVVTARPASSSVPAGTNVAVTGTLAPAQPGKELELQRLYSDGEWRTVNRGRVDANSRYRILATPPGRATYSYRVFARTEAYRSGNTSPTFTIRGT